MAEMWGIAGGSRNFIHDRMQLQRLAMDQQAARDLERHREAQRVATNTELDQRERRLIMDEDALNTKREEERVMSQPEEGEDTSTPEGQIRALRARAGRFLNLGKVDEASKLLNTSAQVLVRLENAANAESQAREREFKLQSEQTRRLQETLTGVRSAADFDRAKMALAAMPEMGELINHPMLEKYDPVALERFIKNSPTWVKQKELALREWNTSSAAALRKARIEHMGLTRELVGRQTAVAEAREARLAKAGAGGNEGAGGTPPAARSVGRNDREETAKYLKAQGLLAGDAGLRNLQISTLAEDALTLAQRNRRFASFSEALEYAVENAKARGELIEEVGAFGSKSRSYKRLEGSASRPINLSADAKDVEFKEGRHYRDPSGNVVRYQNGEFIPVYSANVRQLVPIQPPAATNPLLDEEDDE